MAKFLKFFSCFVIANAGFIIMPMNLGHDLTDFKKILGTRPDDSKLDQIRKLALKERFSTKN